MIRLLRDRIVWPHPEWWAYALSAVAWITIVWFALGDAASDGHAHLMMRDVGAQPSALASAIGHWTLMVVAMMVPFMGGAIRTTAARSLWRRRHRAIALWLAGYSLPWLLLGALVALAGSTRGHRQSAALWVPTAFALAALWQTSDLRARLLNASHRTWPLAPSGWRATRDCVEAGGATAVYCVAACGPLMVACALPGHGPIGIATMIAATAVGFVERYSVRPDPRLLGAGVALPALIAVAF